MCRRCIGTAWLLECMRYKRSGTQDPIRFHNEARLTPAQNKNGTGIVQGQGKTFGGGQFALAICADASRSISASTGCSPSKFMKICQTNHTKMINNFESNRCEIECETRTGQFRASKEAKTVKMKEGVIRQFEEPTSTTIQSQQRLRSKGSLNEVNHTNRIVKQKQSPVNNF